MNLQEQISRIQSMMKINKNHHKYKMYYNEYLTEILNDKNYFELGEEIGENNQNEKTKKVINKIKNGDFINNVKDFKEAFLKSNRPEMLTNYDDSDLKNMKLFKLNGYDIGYALKEKDGDYNEIVSVFNNSGVKNIGKELILSAIKNGGCYLDHYDGFLSDFYESLGFKEYDRYEFDPQYDESGEFRKKYGPADIIFRKHISC
jgi:hypothetical protein